MRKPRSGSGHRTDSAISLVDVEVSGATTAAISFAVPTTARLVGSEIHDNPGTALAIGAGAAPAIIQNVFRRNGMSPHTSGTFTIETTRHRSSREMSSSVWSRRLPASTSSLVRIEERELVSER